MFGPFRITNPLSGGLLWKIPWRLSKFQKRRHRMRLRAADSVVATLDTALARQGQTLEAVERWKAEMPKEEEMLPKDKYTIFDRKAKKFRKGIHSTFFFWVVYTTVEVGMLTSFTCRGSQVDKSIAENQPSWLLRMTIAAARVRCENYDVAEGEYTIRPWPAHPVQQQNSFTYDYSCFSTMKTGESLDHVKCQTVAVRLTAEWYTLDKARRII